MPDALMEVWVWFKRLANRRQSGMGINPIAYSEMKAFFSLMGIYPNPEELILLETFDNMAVSFYSKKQAEASKKPAQKKQGR